MKAHFLRVAVHIIEAYLKQGFEYKFISFVGDPRKQRNK